MLVAAGEVPRAREHREEDESPRLPSGREAERMLMGRNVQGTLVKVCACVCGTQSPAPREHLQVLHNMETVSPSLLCD